MASSPGNLWTILPHGRFRIRVLLALIGHQWFIRLRWIFVALAVALLWAERLQAAHVNRPPLAWYAVATLAVSNLAWAALGKRLHVQISEDNGEGCDALRSVVWFINAQMVVDIFLLTVLLRCSGGVENPMAIFYLFHMLIAALLLKPFNAMLQGAWAILLFAGLAVGECVGWIAPHYPFVSVVSPVRSYMDGIDVLVSIGVLAAGAAGTLYFTLQIASRLDEQERELYHANVALRQSRDAVEHLQEKRSRFLRTAAHQLKTPLASIETLAGLVRDGVVGHDGVQEIVGRIIRRCGEAIVQVTELLTLERIERGSRDHPDVAGAPVRSVLNRVASRFRKQAESKGLIFQVSLLCDKHTIAAVDARNFEDCVGNLLDNAIKYTSTGGTVSLSASDGDNEVRVSVKDTGMGIAGCTTDDLFEPFYRGNAALAANIAGSGLGLTIVREVVQQAHGRISVRSAENEGTEFALWFPSALDKHRQSTTPAPTETALISTNDSHALKSP